MKRGVCIAWLGLVCFAESIAWAEDPPPTSLMRSTEATFLITGLHCPPCMRTVETSLRRAKGIQSVSIDWKGKHARVVFDEKVLPASRLAGLIAGTPHMMGENMHYGGWLSLRVPAVQDEAGEKAAKETLNNVKGVSRVVAYPARRAVAVQFTRDTSVSSQRLIEALEAAGLEASNL